MAGGIGRPAGQGDGVAVEVADRGHHPIEVVEIDRLGDVRVRVRPVAGAMSAGVDDVVNTTTGIVFHSASVLITCRSWRPSRRGMFRSSRIRSGRGAPAYDPSALRYAKASAPFATAVRAVDEGGDRIHERGGNG